MSCLVLYLDPQVGRMMRIVCCNWLSEGPISYILTTRDFKLGLFMPCDQLRL